MTTIVRAADAAHFLSLAPALVGFTPTQSLVAVPMSHGRSVGALRIDLPAADDADQVAATVVGMVCRIHDADALTAIVYTDTPCGGDRLPHAEVAAALESRADASGLDLVDVLCVAADGWGSYLDPECPPEGRPLAEIAVAAVQDVPSPVGDQWTGAELPVATQDERAAVAAALEEIERAVPLLCSDAVRAPKRLDPRALEAAGDLDDLPRLFEDALDDGDEVAGFAAALLVWCLARPALRDIALVGWARGIDAGDDALDAQLGWERGEEYPERLARTVWGEGPRPDAERLRSALELTRRLAALAPGRLAAGPLSVCAWLSWALGRSTHADRYAAEAHRADPDHGLAGIMLSFVAAGHLPDWAFRPSPPSRPPAPRRPSRPGDSFRRVPGR